MIGGRCENMENGKNGKEVVHSMSINPFVAGVLATLFAEMAGMIVWALISYLGRRNK